MSWLLGIAGLLALALVISPRLRHLIGYLILVWIGHGTPAMIRAAKAAIGKWLHGRARD